MDEYKEKIEALIATRADENLRLAMTLAESLGLWDEVIQPYLDIYHWGNWRKHIYNYVRYEGQELWNIRSTLLKTHWNWQNSKIDSLPPFIHQFPKTQAIIASRNKISNFPKNFTQLKNLNTLDLHDNLLTQLPNDIGELEALRKLKLHNNQLKFFPDSFRQLTELNRFYIYNNPLEHYPKYFEEFEYLKRNQGLYLCFQTTFQAFFKGQITVAQNIGALLYLIRVLFRTAEINNIDFALKIARALGIYKAWTRPFLILKNWLIQYGINIKRKDTIRVINCILNFKYLHLHAKGIKEIPKEIALCFNLRELQLQKNKLESIPDSIHHLHKLNTIKLHINPLKEFPNSIRFLTKLSRLHLDYKQWTDFKESIFNNTPKHYSKTLRIQKKYRYDRYYAVQITHRVVLLEPFKKTTPPPELSPKPYLCLKKRFSQNLIGFFKLLRKF